MPIDYEFTSCQLLSVSKPEFQMAIYCQYCEMRRRRNSGFNVSFNAFRCFLWTSSKHMVFLLDPDSHRLLGVAEASLVLGLTESRISIERVDLSSVEMQHFDPGVVIVNELKRQILQYRIDKRKPYRYVTSII